MMALGEEYSLDTDFLRGFSSGVAELMRLLTRLFLIALALTTTLRGFASKQFSRVGDVLDASAVGKEPGIGRETRYCASS